MASKIFKKAGQLLSEHGLDILGAGLTAGAPGVVATVLGKLGLSDKSTDDDVTEALAKADPAQLVELERINSIERVKVLEAELFTQRHQLENVLLDKQSARAMHTSTGDNTPKILTIFICLLWICMAGAMFVLTIPEGNRELVIRMQGSLDGAIATAIAFWLGSSFGSKVKDATISEMSDDEQ